LLTVYGIPNCDTCRAASKWLKSRGQEHEFHDIRVDGLELKTLHRWAALVGWEKLLNVRSRTWRNFSQAERDSIEKGRALTLMFEHPTLIKRPVLQSGETIIVGFCEEEYASLFN
jgi:arsenate reductase